MQEGAALIAGCRRLVARIFATAQAHGGRTCRTTKTCWASSWLVAILTLAGCATPVPADGPLAKANFERWSVHVLTWDANGDRRKTRVWIAEVDGSPYLRTTESRWWRNIERGSRTQILSAGYTYPVSPEAIVEASLRARIDEAFATKYGWLGRLVIDNDRAKSDDPYLRLRSVAGVEDDESLGAE